MELNFPRISFGATAAALALCSLQSSAALAGVVNAQRVIDSTTVFLGVVPAAVTRSHPADHLERRMHGGPPGRSIHNIHIMAALFDRMTGARVTDAQVTARLLGPRGRKWSVRLTPMTVNGALTYGGYTSMGTDMEAVISLDIVRSVGGRSKQLTARFQYEHD